jgi:hypothetical protein
MDFCGMLCVVASTVAFGVRGTQGKANKGGEGRENDGLQSVCICFCNFRRYVQYQSSMWAFITCASRW